MAPNTWPLGASITPLHDSQFCQFADPLRTLCGLEAPKSIGANVALSRSGGCAEAFSSATLAAFGSDAAARVSYTFRGLYDEGLIIVVQETRSGGGNYPTASVGFARAQDFELVG